jgi:hypothetical protein
VLIGLVCDDTLFQFALAGSGLRRQDVAGGGVMTHNLAGTGLLKAFRRTLMGLHLGHILSWEVRSNGDGIAGEELLHKV